LHSAASQPTLYSWQQEKGRASSTGKETGRVTYNIIKGKQYFVTVVGEGRASNVTETKERDLDWSAVWDTIATLAI